MISTILLAVFPACLIYAALSDVRSFRIPNWVSIVLVVAYPIAALYGGMAASEIGQGFLIGFGVLVIGFGLFAANVIGGGDAKLLAAASIWVGPSVLLDFLVIMGLAGGVLTLAILSFRSSPIQPFYVRIGWLMRLHEARAGAPYGLAIAAAGVIIAPDTHIFSAVI